MARARVVAVCARTRMSLVDGEELMVPDGERVLAQAEGMLGESMRFVLDSLRKQMDDAGVRELAAGNQQLRTITITTEVLG